MKGLIAWGRTGAWTLAALAASLALPASADTIFNLNNTLSIDAATGGLNGWGVDGQNQLKQEVLWFRYGSGNNALVSSLGAPTLTRVSDSQMISTWTGSGLTISAKYTLTGTGTGSGSLAQTFTIWNNSGAAINNFVLFQYSDYDLGGNPLNDNAYLNWDARAGKWFGSTQYKDTIQLSQQVDTVVTNPRADHGEVALAGETPGRLAGSTYNLNDLLEGPLAASGDVAWALQWNLGTIDAGASKAVNETASLTGVLVPEPSALALISLGLAGYLIRRRSAVR